MAAIPFLDLQAANQEVRGALDDAYRRVVDAGWFVLGSEVTSFESEFAQYLGVPHCVGCGNGLDAIHLILRALDIGEGDEVIVPSNTFIATWLAVTYVGATPVPVEPLEGTYNIDPALIERAVTPRTRAIIPVHLYGQPAEMTAIMQVAEQHHLVVIEDAAQAHGSSYRGVRAGALGDVAAFSFYPAKNLGALGDGGAVVTRNEDLARRVRRLANYGSERKYVHEVVGFNSRLDSLQAAFLRAKLPLLDEWNARRARRAEQYLARLEDSGIALPQMAAGADSAWHLFVIRLKSRATVLERLERSGIACQIHYPIAPAFSPAYAGLPALKAQCEIARRMSEEVLSLPIGPHLSCDAVDRVCDVLLESVAAA